MQDYETHTSCRICGNTDLITLIDLGNQYLGSVFPNKNEPDPIQAPLVLVKCNDEYDRNNCGLVQLQHTVKNTKLYTNNYGYRSGLNNTMTKHLEKLALFIKDMVCLDKDDIVLDIGCNDATLLSFFPDKVKKVGVDPCGVQFKMYHPPNVKLIPEFFSKNVLHQIVPNNKKVKVVSSISMFYDLPEPLTFARDVASILSDDGVWVMEQSYLPSMLAKNSFDTICHEHLEYYSLKQIEWICDKSDLRIVDVSTNNINGGSFRVAIVKNNSSLRATSQVQDFIKKENSMFLHTRQPYERFKEHVEVEKNKLMDFIKASINKGQTFAIYGASTKGNTLLQYYNIRKEHITAGCAERNPTKYGCRTPGNNIPIYSEEEVKGKRPDYMLVLPWHFKDEFLEREKSFLANGGHLVFPLPYFEIV